MKSWIGLSLLCAITGCGKPVTQSELMGSYVADYSAAKENVTLSSDGKFTQQVTLKANSKTLTTNGAWTFDSAVERITFHDSFFSVLDGFGQQRKQPELGTTNLPVVSQFGKIQIGGDPSIEYKKQPGP